MPKLHILPSDIDCDVEKGTNLLEALRAAGIFIDAPCGGNGRCGKCTVTADGQEVLACQTTIEDDMQVLIPDGKGLYVMQSGIETDMRMDPLCPGPLLAIDIGTTSVVCFLLDGTDGRELATSSSLNPQTAFGADVISRIRAAMSGQLEQERDLIRQELTRLITDVCAKTSTDPASIGVVSVVGNPAMQQLFMGIMPDNLAAIPFAPVLTEMKTVPCRDILPVCGNALLIVVPDISGYVGADTLGCVLSTRMYESEELTLMVDIGTNGEMVLGNKDRMIDCSVGASHPETDVCSFQSRARRS